MMRRLDSGTQPWERPLKKLEDNWDSVNTVKFSPDGKQLASASDDGTVRVWDTATGAAPQMLEGHSDVVNAVAFSPDGEIVAETLALQQPQLGLLRRRSFA